MNVFIVIVLLFSKAFVISPASFIHSFIHSLYWLLLYQVQGLLKHFLHAAACLRSSVSIFLQKFDWIYINAYLQIVQTFHPTPFQNQFLLVMKSL